ncbi:NADP-dependent phosphogluconate dehydrogenase [Persicimonas caeni]|uniref:NADP-dependent phosphogluconate dehydrogenase n=1 Tax=Persicimonas caeni TaxID=2292766 RepID=A0A4Y6PZT1_PERCE|nr:NADP-dependent phosphogluconate dehydrogenase [Persicimonas caeni]QDG53838.1 NADP-dependent phosphogluconate dehydrogenase [Persicimonas caeni]QED35059.1 NADP-dependent phosphogluconate dehydrogenase [Persicimonas caeni]
MKEQLPSSFGVVGLGRIGGGLARQALGKGIAVVGHDTSEPPDELVDAGLEYIDDVSLFAERLDRPRVVFLYVPAGAVVDEVCEELAPVLDDGDVIVDGGNSYWGDSLRRYERLKEEHGVEFVDCGTSGGVRGAEQGACFMAGGTRQAFEVIEPVLKALSVDGGYVHCGGPAAGHFVKLVHNGIEFGMLQAIGEGMQLLERYRDELPIAEVLRTWTNGSVIRSWLVELMEEQYRAQGGTGDIPPFVEDTGEVNWLVDDAMHMEVPVPVIAQSVMQLLASRDSDQTWARAVALMRHGFGEHPFGADEGVEHHRKSSRLGPFPGA